MAGESSDLSPGTRRPLSLAGRDPVKLVNAKTKPARVASQIIVSTEPTGGKAFVWAVGTITDANKGTTKPATTPASRIATAFGPRGVALPRSIRRD